MVSWVVVVVVVQVVLGLLWRLGEQASSAQRVQRIVFGEKQHNSPTGIRDRASNDRSMVVAWDGIQKGRHQRLGRYRTDKPAGTVLLRFG